MEKYYYYGCALTTDERLGWRCELFDSFVEAREHVRMSESPVTKVVSVSRVWPGFVRREIRNFELCIPVIIPTVSGGTDPTGN